MAKVTQCDICGNIIDGQSKFIEIFDVNRYNLKNKRIISKYICDECYKNLEKIINKAEQFEW